MSRVPRNWSRLGRCSLLAVVCVFLGPGAERASATFPGENGLIVFVSDRDGDSDIYAMNPDGSNVRNLTNNDTALDFSPSVSPDGSKIAFVSDRADRRNWEIYVMEADGSNAVRLTFAPGKDLWPAWSPSGLQLAFNTRRDGDHEIYTMNADGSNQVNLTNSPTTGDWDPDWSPRGGRIAFARIPNGPGAFDVFDIRTDGTEVRQLTDAPGHDDSPSYSPDGRRIAFDSAREGFSDIFVMNADGSNETKISRDPAGGWKPAWSPNGKRIAFVSLGGNETADDVFSMRADGSNQKNLTNQPRSDYSPAWQPLPRR